MTYRVIQSAVDLSFKDPTDKPDGVNNHTMDLWYASQAIGILNMWTYKWEMWKSLQLVHDEANYR